MLVLLVSHVLHNKVCFGTPQQDVVQLGIHRLFHCLFIGVPCSCIFMCLLFCVPIVVRIGKLQTCVRAYASAFFAIVHVHARRRALITAKIKCIQACYRDNVVSNGEAIDPTVRQLTSDSQ